MKNKKNVIEFEKTKIRSYENFIREIIDTSVRRLNWDKLDKENKMFTDKIKELFKFDSSECWSFLTSSLDTLGDSTFAITSFLNHKLGNETKFDTGEQYLRLYGVLSSVYIHFRAISTLADLVKIKTNDLEKKFKDSDISFLRNVISAHPVNFDDNGRKKNFKIARYSLNDTGKLEIVSMKNEFTSYDLFNSINQYLKFAEETLEKIATKLIKNRYKSSKEKLEEYINNLEKIKAQ